MANKGPSYGMSRQVQDKIEQKYDPELEVRLVEWIGTQCGSGVGKPEAGKLGFQAWLKDGCVSHLNQKPTRAVNFPSVPINRYLDHLSNE
uniref:Transgelin n=1 Tax=Cyprinus carpio TaxID=7962 RepID=A0A8C1LI12_CYPCA